MGMQRQDMGIRLQGQANVGASVLARAGAYLHFQIFLMLCCQPLARAGHSRPHFTALLDVAGRQAPLFQVLLVIIRGGMEGHCRHDLGNNRFLEAAGLLEFFF